MKRTILRLLLLLVPVLLLLAALPARRVAGDEMAWTVQDGEWVWVLPMRIRKGDMVLLRDPLDPSRKVLRRAVASGGEKVRYEDGAVRVNGKRIRQTRMGESGPYQVLKEVIWSSPPARANKYFVRVRADGVRYSLPDKVEVPEGSWFLLADDRDGALDSRWWGPIPEDDILGVVRFHLRNQADPWRETRWALVLPIE